MASRTVERASETSVGRASIPPSGVELHGWAAPATAVAVGAQPLVQPRVSWAARLLGRVRHPFPSRVKLAAGHTSVRPRRRAPGVVPADWAYLTEIAPRLHAGAWTRLVIARGRGDLHRSP